MCSPCRVCGLSTTMPAVTWSSATPLSGCWSTINRPSGLSHHARETGGGTMTHPELEISLHRRDTLSFAVQLRFHDPEQEAEQRDEAFPVRFDHDRLRELALDPAAYGRLLGENLFSHAGVRSCLEKARAAV